MVKELACRSVGTFDVTNGQMVHGPSTDLWHLFYIGRQLTRILGPFACRSADKRMEMGEQALLLQCEQPFEGDLQNVLGRIDRLTGAFFVSTTRATNVLARWGTCTSPDGTF